MSVRFASIFVLSLLGTAIAAQADECPRFGDSLRQVRYTAVMTVSGPSISVLPCGRGDCATAIFEGVTGHDIDAKTLHGFAEPTTTYLSWNGTAMRVGDGEVWREVPAQSWPAQIASPASAAIAMTCHNDGAAVLDGKTATLYRTHAEGAGMVIDATAWIDAASGLPLKQIQHIKNGRESVVIYNYAPGL